MVLKFPCPTPGGPNHCRPCGYGSIGCSRGCSRSGTGCRASTRSTSRFWKPPVLDKAGYRAWQLSSKQIPGTIETWSHCFYIKGRLFGCRSSRGSIAWIMVIIWASMPWSWGRDLAIRYGSKSKVLLEIWISVRFQYCVSEGTCFLAGISIMFEACDYRDTSSSEGNDSTWWPIDPSAWADALLKILRVLTASWRASRFVEDCQVSQSPWKTNASRDLLHLYTCIYIYIYMYTYIHICIYIQIYVQ